MYKFILFFILCFHTVHSSTVAGSAGWAGYFDGNTNLVIAGRQATCFPKKTTKTKTKTKFEKYLILLCVACEFSCQHSLPSIAYRECNSLPSSMRHKFSILFWMNPQFSNGITSNITLMQLGNETNQFAFAIILIVNSGIISNVNIQLSTDGNTWTVRNNCTQSVLLSNNSWTHFVCFIFHCVSL